MSDPRRWLEQGGASLEAALLRAARADAPPAGAKQKALEALGLGTDAAAQPGAAQAHDASRGRFAADRAPAGGAALRGLSRRSARLPPAARAVLFESVLRGEPRAGLFGPGGAGLPVLLAVAAAAAFWVAMPQRARPHGLRGIEVAEMPVPVAKTELPAAGEPSGAFGVRQAHPPRASSERPVHGRLVVPAGNPRSPSSDQGDPVAPSPSLADGTEAPAPDAPMTEAPAPDAPVISEPAETPAAVGPPASSLTVLPFGPGMTTPVLISGRDPLYTREALSARVEGTVSVKCTITTLGTLTHCRVQQSVPWMDQAVLDAMATRRYRPVTYQSRPISVDYVFTIRLVLPK
jgi:protein TonB